MVIQIKNKDSIQKYVVELKRWGINCEVRNESDLHFEPSLFDSTETKAYNRILNMQIEERLPVYMMAHQDHKVFKADNTTIIKTKRFINSRILLNSSENLYTMKGGLK